MLDEGIEDFSHGGWAVLLPGFRLGCEECQGDDEDGNRCAYEEDRAPTEAGGERLHGDGCEQVAHWVTGLHHPGKNAPKAAW